MRKRFIVGLWNCIKRSAWWMYVIRVVVFDLDGVLVPFRSSWEFLHRYFGVVDDRLRNENIELFYKGLISYEEWMRRDLTLLTSKGCITKEDVVKAFKSVELRRGAKELCEYLISNGLELAIVSGGVDVLAHQVGNALNIRRVYSNKLLFDEGDCLQPYGVEVVNPLKKDVILTAISTELGVPLSNFMYVGDTVWDLCAFRVVGYPVVINCEPCLNILNQWGKEYLVVDELYDIIPFVDGIIRKSVRSAS
ncbi:MAG: HAD-IB family phosphatase [Sulfolobales archaeon]